MKKIFEIGSSFHMKWGNAGRVQFLFFKGFLLVLKKYSFGWQLGCNSIKFWDFPDISYFPTFLYLNLFGNSYIPYLLLIITLRFTYGAKKIWSNIKKFQNIMTMIIHISPINKVGKTSNRKVNQTTSGRE